MTSTKAIITIVIIWIITITAWLFEMSHASDMDCFNKEVAQMQLKQAKWLKAKIEAKRSLNQWTLLCNKPI